MAGLDLREWADKWVYLEEGRCWFLEQVPYCLYPEVPGQQCMNLFVPEAYLEGNGNIREDGECRGYTAWTAPVIFENGLAGYKEAEPFGLADPRGAAREFLEAGFVYVSCGCRGRSSRNRVGDGCGKAPFSLVDLKAGVRFLKHNAGVIPGNMERIVSVGISAGGAMSSLLGSTGNSREYEELLRRIGAVMTEGDDIFAAQCYCPITDLDHADIAYEWMFQGQAHYTGMPFLGFSEGDLTPFAAALSESLAGRYPAYFNGLGLTHPRTGEKMEIGEDLSGSGYEYLMEKLEQSASKFFQKLERGEAKVEVSPEDYRTGNYQEWKPLMAHSQSNDRKPGMAQGGGQDSNMAQGQCGGQSSDMAHSQSKDCKEQGEPQMAAVPGIDKSGWLSWDGREAHIAGMKEMQENYHRRLKLCPAFDDLDLIQAENQEFGRSDLDLRHFDSEVAPAMEPLAGAFPEETEKYLPGYREVLEDPGLDWQKRLLNPLNYIRQEGVALAPHFRIRVGSRDADTSLTVTMTLALMLMQTGKVDVDYEIVWDEPHGRADYPGEMAEWVRSLADQAAFA